MLNLLSVLSVLFVSQSSLFQYKTQINIVHAITICNNDATYFANVDNWNYIDPIEDTIMKYPFDDIKPKYPIALLHGISSDKSELEPVVKWLNTKVPNTVYNLEIGNGRYSSIFKPMHWQLEQLCNTIYNIPELKNGFHFICISQGGLLCRGYVEQCNKYPVINLITWVSPHAGIYGLGTIDISFDLIYTFLYQNIYSFTGYWKDPFKYQEYLNKSSYLATLNNENQNIILKQLQSQKNNMLSLKNFVMIWSPNDEVLSPPESGKFSFYDINYTKYDKYKNINLPIIDLFDSIQYKHDLIGLKTLNNSGRLHIFETDCSHVGHKTQKCFPQLENLTLPFL